MSDKQLILPKKGEDVNSAIQNRLLSERIAGYVTAVPAGHPERWRRIRQVWSQVDKHALEDHREACLAAQFHRENAEDRDYGTTRATRGKAHGEEVNGQIRNALVAIMPETLKAWLVKYDPYLNKEVNRGAKEQRKAWRKVYATFPEYRTTLKQGDW